MTTINLKAIPPSTNHLYANVPGKGRVKSDRYRTWCQASGWDLKLQRPGRIEGEVELIIDMERTSSLSDISNRIKALEDLLVEHGVIEDDRHVVKVTIGWAPIKGCSVTVLPACGRAVPLLGTVS